MVRAPMSNSLIYNTIFIDGLLSYVQFMLYNIISVDGSRSYVQFIDIYHNLC